MSIETARNALLWCAVIDYGVLIMWFLLLLLPHQWLYRLSGRPFHLTAEQFDAVNLAGIVLFKILVIIFNLVPYIALRIIG
jgi:hypothetical protein